MTLKYLISKVTSNKIARSVGIVMHDLGLFLKNKNHSTAAQWVDLHRKNRHFVQLRRYASLMIKRFLFLHCDFIFL